MSFFTKNINIDKNGERIVRKKARPGRIVVACIIAVFVILTLCLSFTVIPTGFSGVRTTFGQISQATVQPGFNLKIPYIQTIEKVNNKQQDVTYSEQIWSETSERTAIYYENVTVTYQINPLKSAWIYANVSDYRNTLVSQGLVASSIKSASKQLTAVDATNRSIIEPLAQEMLQSSFDSKYGDEVVIVNKVVIGNVDFDESYNAAIAEKQNAQLAYETQQVVNKKALEKAEADAQVKKTEAQGEADAKLIAANAEAEANRIVADSITDEILRNRFYDVWDGKVPSVVGSTDMMYDVSGIVEGSVSAASDAQTGAGGAQGDAAE